MDYKDLQINDWVYLSESTKYAMQVSLIDKYECSLDFEGNEADPFDAIYGEGGIAPIPLTEKMMRKNFSGTESKTWIAWYKGSEKVLRVCVNGSGSVSKFVFFVHELQHILRLLGHTEIADNFKIR